MRRLGLVILIALCACGQIKPVPTGTVASAPGTGVPPKPINSQEAYVLLSLKYYDAYIDTAHFVKPDGSPIGSVTLPPNAEFPTLGGNAVYAISNGHLLRATSDGSITELGILQGASQTMGLGGLAVSPDGQRWAWSEVHANDTSNTYTFDTAIHVAGVTTRDSVLFREANSPDYLKPIIWTKAGLVAVETPYGVGSTSPFGDTFRLAAKLIDLSTGGAKTLSGKGCQFSAVAVDTSSTCLKIDPPSTGFPGAPGLTTVELIKPDGITSSFITPKGGWTYGHALVSPDLQHIAVGAWLRDSDSSGQVIDRPSTYEVGLPSGTWTNITDSGLPYGWTPAAGLVIGSWHGAAFQSYVLAPDRSQTEIGPGWFMGAITASGAVISQTMSEMGPW